ncbi:pilus assembly protein N-terminal domain-containing protein, partial [Escherichia coli]|uniref:pilus assembly protein N-terminal domain-containing protein n=1 Tax=Escherichia coli TaxID=562 RepID=UPI0015F71913
STVPRQSAEQSANRAVQLGVGKSLPVDLPRDARDVIVANPAIANAVVRLARRAFLIGVAVGQTNVFFLDAEGRQIA